MLARVVRKNKAGERIWEEIKGVQFLIGWLGKTALKRLGDGVGGIKWTTGSGQGWSFPAGKVHCKGSG